MELKIYNQSGILKLTVSTASSSTLNQELMMENAVSASFTHPFYMPLDVNDYVLLEGVKFSVKKEYKPKQKNTQTYDYSVKFYAPEHDAQQVMYLNLTDGQYNPQFSLDGGPREHMQKWLENMNRIYGSAVWSIGDVVVADNQTIEYNNVTCWDALASISEAFGTEWWADGFVMNLSRCERGEQVELGYMQGLTSLTQSENSSDVKFFTRLIPLGTTKNIDRSRYGYTRLQLPDKSAYVDRNTHYGLYEHVEEAAFAEIFPHYTGTVTAVRSEEKIGEDKKPFTVYYFKDSGMNFDPSAKENEIGGLVKHVSFQTGDLGGRDFEANYKSETGEWEIINTYPSDEVQIPGGNLIPAVGDTYIPWNFRMPVAYEVQAELDFEAAVADFLAKYSEDISKYGGDTDYTYIDKQSVTLLPGQRVRLLSDKYFSTSEGYRDTRLTKVVRKLDNLSMASIECANQVGKGWKSQVDSSLLELQYTVAVQKTESILYVLKSGEPQGPTEYNVFSAKRTLKEIAQRAVSRLEDDTIAGHIAFEGGSTHHKHTTFEGGVTVRSTLTQRRLRSELSSALSEEGTPELLSSALSEVPTSGGFDGGTLGDLDNTDVSFDTCADGTYLFQKKNGIYFPVKGGGGIGSKMVLTSISEALVTVAHGHDVPVRYTFSSSLEGEATGEGAVTYTVNGRQAASGAVQQGENSFSAGKYLSLGNNTLVIQVTDAYGSMRRLTYQITAVQITISSTYDDTKAYTGAITFPYTPVGVLEKTVHFVIGGKEYTQTTTVSNRQLTYSIPAQTHGAHLLEVYMTAVVGDVTIKSETLRYSVISLAPGNNTVVISSAFHRTEAEQFETVVIPYVVYNPSVANAAVTLSANGSVVSEQTVDRTRQVWSYRADVAGALDLKITCGSVSKSFSLAVTESSIDVQPELADLVLFLTSINRSNNEEGKQAWSYGTIFAVLTAFNWATNGWIRSLEGFVGLRVSGDARVHIPYTAFGNDFRAIGKTLEFEFDTRDVTDYDVPVISCMNGGIGLEVTAQKAIFKSQQTTVITQFKENERVRVAFVVEKRVENRLIYVYVNGEICGVVQYPDQDNFTQQNPVGISIGNSECTVDMFNVRIYDNNLNRYQLLDNYIADMDNLTLKRSLYERNKIYTDYGDVSYDKICNQMPTLTIIGRLPAYKGDKVTCVMVYEDRQDASRCWTCLVVQNDVQGTSSQYYPRKNYKFKFKGGLMIDGTSAKKFPVRNGEIPVDCFCVKADFAESSGCHNTGMARMVDFILRGMGQLTPPQKIDSRVRTTIDGYPICIFHQETQADEAAFLGKYNFNNDKSTQETFGFTAGCECWELKNNTSNRVKFLSSDYTSLDADGNPDWLNDFEARYPDEDDLNAEYEAGKIPVNLKRLTDWLIAVKGNPAKFKAEAAQYWDVKFLLSYYILTEFFAMVDQRAKNMFLTTYDGVHWLPIFYDNDTCLGINNEGVNTFDFTVEYHDKLGTQDTWNGEASSLWNNVEQAYKDEIFAMYADMRTNNLLTYDVCDRFLHKEQGDRWCESVYNEDGWFKYIRPLLEEGNGSYLYAAQGSRKMHRVWWLHNRFKYMDSKYVTGDFKSDYATMRLYTPTEWTGVKPNADITITSYSGQYVNVKYGSYIIGARTKKNVSYKVVAPAIQFNDTETIIYGASQISSLGDLSALYAGTIDVSKMTKLIELIVGSGVSGYKNTNLHVLSVGANELMRKLDVRNCPNLTQAIDLSKCTAIKEVWAEGTGVTAVSLASGGSLTLLHLPGTITNLTVRNQPQLMDKGLVLAGVENLAVIRWENSNGVNILTVIEQCNKLTRVRLTGLDCATQTLDVVAGLVGLGGVNEHGDNVDKAVVTGKLHVKIAAEEVLAVVRETFQELVVTYDNFAAIPKRIIRISKEDTGAVIDNCAITVNGVSYVTDVNGEVILKTGERLNVNVSGVDGYEDFTVSYPVSSLDRTHSVALKKSYFLDIKVLDEVNMGIKDVVVTIPGRGTLTTSHDGVARFKLPGGSYSYSASYRGVQKSGSHTIYTSNTSLTLTYEVDLNDYKPIPDGSIQVLVGTHTPDNVVKISVRTKENTDIVIAWGDGVEETISMKKNNLIVVTHLYSHHGYFNVCTHTYDKLVLFCSSGFLLHGQTDYIDAYWTIGGSSIAGMNFHYFKYLRIVGNDMFINDVDRTDFGSIFNDSGLKKIPDGLFDGCAAALSFQYSFYNCFNIKEIPENLFDYCPLVTSFSYAFSIHKDTRKGSGLKSIPPGLFKNNKNVESIIGLFFVGYDYSSFPPDNEAIILQKGLFDSFTEVNSLSSVFRGMPIKEVENGFFDNMMKVKNIDAVFMGCRILRKIPSNIFNNMDVPYNTYGSGSEYTFKSTSIEHMVLPLTMKNVGRDYSASALVTVKSFRSFPQTPPKLYYNESIGSPNSIYVPDASIEDYKASTNWKYFWSRIKPMSQFSIDFPDVE